MKTELKKIEELVAEYDELLQEGVILSLEEQTQAFILVQHLESLTPGLFGTEAEREVANLLTRQLKNIILSFSYNNPPNKITGISH